MAKGYDIPTATLGEALAAADTHVRETVIGLRPARGPKRRKPSQVQVMFPVDTGLEFRFVFADGKESAWRAADKGIVQVPPAARKIEWRQPQPPENKGE